MALEEHAMNSRNGLFDESMSSFFRNVDTRYSEPAEIPVGNGTTPISSLKVFRGFLLGIHRLFL